MTMARYNDWSAAERAATSAAAAACSASASVGSRTTSAGGRAVGPHAQGGAAARTAASANWNTARKRVIPLCAFKLKLKEKAQEKERIDVADLACYLDLYRSEVRSTAQVIEETRDMDIASKDRDFPCPPLGPNGICRSHFTLKAVTSAHAILFPQLCKKAGSQIDWKFDIATLFGAMQTHLAAAGGEWRPNAHCSWVIRSVTLVHVQKMNVLFRQARDSEGRAGGEGRGKPKKTGVKELKVVILANRHTAAKRCPNVQVVDEVRWITKSKSLAKAHKIVRLYFCLDVCVCAYMFVCVSVCAYVLMCVCVCVCIYISNCGAL